MLYLAHTHYSYKQAVASIDSVAKRSKDLGESSFCIADTNSIISFVKAFKAADKYGIKFIPGCEFLVKPDDDFWKIKIREDIDAANKKLRLKRTTDGERAEIEAALPRMEKQLDVAVDYHKIVIIALNQQGLVDLVSIYNTMFKVGELKFIDIEKIRELGRNLVCIMGSASPMHFWNDNAEKLREIEETYSSIFSQVYVDPTINSFLPKFLYHDVRYAIPEDRDAFRTFYSMMNESIDEISVTTHEPFMMTDEELKSTYALDESVIAECLANSKKLSDAAEKMCMPKGESLKDLSKELEQLCIEGWEKKRKGTEYEEQSWERFHYELSIINSKNFSQYFIKIIKIINTCKRLNILVGPARGSGGGSEICYLTDIIKIDPLKYGLFFERFLNPGRNGFPDIDIDLSAETEYEGKVVASRNLVVSELLKNGDFHFAYYIQNEVAATTTVLFKTLARYYELPYEEANRITKETGGFGEKLKEKEYTGWLREACETLKLDYTDWWDRMESKMEILYRLDGIPYNSSIAASGVIMGDNDPVLPINEGTDGNDVIGFNGVDLESLGYIKFDLLSISTLCEIQYFDGVDVVWNENGDSKVWDSIDRGETDFVFQFSSPGMKGILEKVKPRDITTLAEINALYRPGPLESGLVEKYIAIKTNQDVELTDEESIMYGILKREFGEDHSGLLVFQEDVMKICQIGAGFTLQEADDIRKAMGKKKIEVLKPYQQKFVEGWKFEGDPDKIWRMLENYSGYAFNKSHSVAYAVIAYATQRNWVYKRDELLQFELNSKNPERFKAAADKCKELGIKIKFPDCNNCKGEGYTIANGTLYLPGECDKEYSTPAEMLFDPDLDHKLILKGLFDNLTHDRFALSQLVDGTLKTFKPTLQAMPYISSLGSLLNEMINVGAVIDYKLTKDGETVIRLKKTRGEPATITIKPNGNYDVCREMYNLDMKYFGFTHPGVLDSLPFVETTGIINTLESIKGRMAVEGYKESAIYYKLRTKLEDYVAEMSERRKVFEGVTAILTMAKVYDKTMKIWLKFSDKEDIFYVNDPEIINTIKATKFNSLVRLKMIYSPFIRKRNNEFIYDFDIMGLEVV